MAAVGNAGMGDVETTIGPFSTEALQDAIVSLVQETEGSLKTQVPVSKFLRRYLEPVKQLGQRRMGCKDFAVVQVIGQGAFGSVSLVKHTASGGMYALKAQSKANLLEKLQLDDVNFMEERDIMAMTESPWLVRAIYSFQDAHYIYLAMEYLPGGDMYQLMCEKDLPLDWIQFYSAELMCAIDAVHTLGYVHRDLKPDNIMFDAQGHLKLTDFGLACRLDARGSATAQAAIGTPAYIAPEVWDAASGKPHSHMCDYWSAGIIIFEMCVGETPFTLTEEDPSSLQIIAGIQKIVRSNAVESDVLAYPSDCHMNPEGRRFIKDLLAPATSRLGARSGLEEIKAHPFFKGIEWGTLRSQPAKFQPDLTSSTDTKYFTDEFKDVKQNVKLVMDPRKFNGTQLPFVGFSYNGQLKPANGTAGGPETPPAESERSSSVAAASEIKLKNREIDELRHKVGVFEKTQAATSSTVRDMEKETSRLKAELEANKTEAEQLHRTSSSRLRDQLHEAGFKAEKLTIELDREKTERAVVEKALRRDIVDLRAELAKVDPQLRSSVDKLGQDRLRSELAQAEAALSNEAGRTATLQSTVAQQASSMAELQSELAAATSSLKLLQTENSKLQDSARHSEGQLLAFRKQSSDRDCVQAGEVAQAKKKVSALKWQLTNAQSQLRRFEDSHKRLNDSIHRGHVSTDQSLDASRNKPSAAEALRSAQEEVAALHERLHEQSAELVDLETLESKLIEAEALNEEFEAALSESYEETSIQATTIAELEGRLSKTAAEKERLDGLEAEYRAKTGQLAGEVAALRADNTQLAVRAEDLETRTAFAEQQRDALREQGAGDKAVIAAQMHEIESLKQQPGAPALKAEERRGPGLSAVGTRWKRALLEVELKQAQQRITSLQGDLQDSVSAKKKAKMVSDLFLAKERSEVLRLKNEIRELNVKMMEFKEDRALHSQRLAYLEAELKDTADAKKNLIMEVTAIKAELEAAEEHAKQQRVEVEKANNKLVGFMASKSGKDGASEGSAELQAALKKEKKRNRELTWKMASVNTLLASRQEAQRKDKDKSAAENEQAADAVRKEYQGALNQLRKTASDQEDQLKLLRQKLAKSRSVSVSGGGEAKRLAVVHAFMTKLMGYLAETQPTDEALTELWKSLPADIRLGLPSPGHRSGTPLAARRRMSMSPSPASSPRHRPPRAFVLESPPRQPQPHRRQPPQQQQLQQRQPKSDPARQEEVERLRAQVAKWEQAFRDKDKKLKQLTKYTNYVETRIKELQHKVHEEKEARSLRHARGGGGAIVLST